MNPAAPVMNTRMRILLVVVGRSDPPEPPPIAGAPASVKGAAKRLSQLDAHILSAHYDGKVVTLYRYKS
jgi:hypothetical protein